MAYLAGGHSPRRRMEIIGCAFARRICMRAVHSYSQLIGDNDVRRRFTVMDTPSLFGRAILESAERK